MSQRSKRKLDSYEEPTFTMPTYAHERQHAQIRPQPTPELQEMYNNIRRMEEALSLEDRLQLREGPGGNDSPGGELLQPPTPSAPSMSRTPSYASTSHSVTQALNDVGLDDDQSQDRPSNKKRRPGRQGPLDKFTKARTAFMRKLGACDTCRNRKVKCKHYDLILFDEGYEASRQTRRAAQSISPNPNSKQPRQQQQQQQQQHKQQRQQAPRPYQPRLGSSHDLFGIGLGSLPGVCEIGPNLLNLLPIFPGTQDDAHTDFDDLLLQTPSISEDPAPLYNFRGNRGIVSLPASSPVAAPMVIPYGPLPTEVAPSQQTISASESYVPIGRLLLTQLGEEWECKWRDDGTIDSSVSSDETTEPCNKRYSRLVALCNHFSSEHTRYWKSGFVWKCTGCGLLWLNEPPTCPQCARSSAWEKWYYGNVSSVPSMTSGPSVRVASGDGSMMNPPPSGGSSNRNHTNNINTLYPSWNDGQSYNNSSSSGYYPSWGASGNGGEGGGAGNGKYHSLPSTSMRHMVIDSGTTAKASLKGSCPPRDRPRSSEDAVPGGSPPYGSGSIAFSKHHTSPLSSLSSPASCPAASYSEDISKTISFNRAHSSAMVFPRAVAMSLVTVVVVEVLLSARGWASLLSDVARRVLAEVVRFRRAHVEALALACILVGVLGMWRFRRASKAGGDVEVLWRNGDEDGEGGHTRDPLGLLALS